MLGRRVVSIIGTRPEAIKMAPVVRALAVSGLDSIVCVTGQHRQMLDQALDLFDIHAGFDLDVMRAGQRLDELTASILMGVTETLAQSRPDLVLVHGDTTTAFASALAAFYQRIPVAHVEAGLRTQNLEFPWPEEANRLLVDHLSALHFAPTEGARANLLAENIAESRITVTGNTVIDALKWMSARIKQSRGIEGRLGKRFPFLAEYPRMLLVTGHRRESFGDGFDRICDALSQLAADDPKLLIVYPVHLNPNVKGPVSDRLSGVENIQLLPPLDYEAFVYLMNRSSVILTDSGGVQEEAPSLGKPVLVMRDVTERPEAVESGGVEMVGTDVDRICSAVRGLFGDPERRARMSESVNPYGDGEAAQRIAARVIEFLTD